MKPETVETISSDERRKRLAFLEDFGRQHMAAQGVALKSIGEKNLYRENYSSLENYALLRWGFSAEYMTEAINLGEWASKIFPWIGRRSYSSNPILQRAKSKRLTSIGISGVYFIEAVGSGLVKIGVSGKSVSIRLSELQTASPHDLALLLVVTGSSKEEFELHQKFSHLRKRGEWFQLTSEILDFITEKKKEQAV